MTAPIAPEFSPAMPGPSNSPSQGRTTLRKQVSGYHVNPFLKMDAMENHVFFPENTMKKRVFGVSGLSFNSSAQRRFEGIAFVKLKRGGEKRARTVAGGLEKLTTCVSCRRQQGFLSL